MRGPGAIINNSQLSKEGSTRCGSKVMRLIFCLPKFLFFSNINVIPFKIIPLGSYAPTETLFPLLAAALEVFNRYGLQHVRYSRD